MEEVAFNPTIELPELAQEWGNRPLEGTNKTLCACQDPGERKSGTTRVDPDLPVSVQESQAEVWISGGLLHGWGH